MALNLVYQMQIPNCTNCGKHLSHLYPDYRSLCKQLIEELEYDMNHAEDSETKLFVPSGSYKGQQSGLDITPFIKTYYTWKVRQNEEGVKTPIFTPLAIIGRALLAIKPLEEDQLPFGTKREADGQRWAFDQPLCCMRYLMCNPASNL